jgi:hypothetical protein
MNGFSERRARNSRTSLKARCTPPSHGAEKIERARQLSNKLEAQSSHSLVAFFASTAAAAAVGAAVRAAVAVGAGLQAEVPGLKEAALKFHAQTHRLKKDRKYQHYYVNDKGTSIGKAGKNGALSKVWWVASDSEASSTCDYILPGCCRGAESQRKKENRASTRAFESSRIIQSCRLASLIAASVLLLFYGTRKVVMGWLDGHVLSAVTPPSVNALNCREDALELYWPD